MKNIKPLPELLTPVEAALLLKMSRDSVYSLIERRRIPFYRIERSIRFDKEDVIAYFEKTRVEAIGK